MLDASVLIVNYNGKPYLEDLLRSLERQTHPSFEILVVDNGSTDGSAALVRQSFPQVRWIEAGENLGFAGGNNLGIREARGEYVALLNNDTVVDPRWLEALVEEARTGPEIAAVGSKIVFARPFVPVTLEVLEPPCEPGLFLARRAGFENCSYDKPLARSGFRDAEPIDGVRGWWADGPATVLLPVELAASLDASEYLVLRTWNAWENPLRVRIRIEDAVLTELDAPPAWHEHRIAVTPELLRKRSFDVLNNAGSFLGEDGQAGDRGIFEPDRGQYDVAEDVSALCGCSMLISRSVLERIGAFDETYFTYFEDIELSWRLRRAGYRLRYQPKSLVRHYHAATSVEGSARFTYYVDRNRILMLLRHAPFRSAIRAYVRELYLLARLVCSRRSLQDPDTRVRLRIQLGLLKHAPRSLWKRFRGWYAHSPRDGDSCT